MYTIVSILSLGIGILVVLLLAYLVLNKDELSRSARKRGFGDSSIDVSNISITDTVKKYKLYFGLLALLLIGLSCVHTVPPGFRGVLVTFGSVSDRILGEGLNTKLPWQSVVNMKVTLEVIEVDESTASNDLQEVTTQLAVHYNVMPDRANEVYREMKMKYDSLLLRPVIQEDLKAVTAQWTAEELVTKRPLVVLALEDKLRASVEVVYGIRIQTVNIVDFQFSLAFSEAIEEKVTAEQNALTAKNYLEQVRWEQEQAVVIQEAEARIKLIQAEAQRNATITESLGEAEAVMIAADAQYYRTIQEQQGIAEGIEMVTSSITEEYVRYLYMLEWDGDLPDVLAGVEGTDILLLLEQDTGG